MGSVIIKKTQNSISFYGYTDYYKYLDLYVSLKPYINQSIDSRLQQAKTVPLGMHQIYSNPSFLENELATDGYHTFGSPASMKHFRRMWYRSSWKENCSLPFNEKYECIMSWDTIFASETKNIIRWNISLLQNGILMIEELRDLIYLSNEHVTTERDQNNLNLKRNVDKEGLELCLTPLLLFRYSALTFNAHKIHYDLDYAKKEGYSNLLVQGPLSATLLLLHSKPCREFSFKAIRPLFANEKIFILPAQTEILNSKKELSMKGYLK